MPAAFYEFNIEQSSDFLSALRILKPEDGTLFKFRPNVGERFWKNDNSSVNFDITNEIKLLYPTPVSAFGYLQTNAELTFLTVRMKIKDSTGSATNTKIEGRTVCNNMLFIFLEASKNSDDRNENSSNSNTIDTFSIVIINLFIS